MVAVVKLPGPVTAHVGRRREALERAVTRLRASVAAHTVNQQPYDIEFEEGGYVLHADVHRGRGKLQVKRVGPMLVVKAKVPWVYRLHNIETW